MEFSITIYGRELSFLEEAPPLYEKEELGDNCTYISNTNFGKISARKISGDGFTIWDTEYLFKEPVVLNIKSGKPVLLLHFLFQDSVQVTVDNRTFVLRSGQYNLTYSPGLEAIVTTGKKEHLHTFHIYFEPSFLKIFMNGRNKTRLFLNSIGEGSTSWLSGARHFASPEVISIIRSLFENKYNNKNAKLFTASQVTILLIKALEELNRERDLHGRIKISKEDLEKIYFIEAYLQKNLDEIVPISKLARLAGLNESKLKHGFKNLFGSTISSYHEELRLQEAMRLLTETELPVSEVGIMVGYLYPQHFSKKFKKKFGFTPLYFRKA